MIDYDAQSEAKKDKHLWTEKEYGDFVLRVEWRIKETPYINPRIKYVLPDGTNAQAPDGKELNLPLPDSDSGIILRGDVKNQVNIWSLQPPIATTSSEVNRASSNSENRRTAEK